MASTWARQEAARASQAEIAAAQAAAELAANQTVNATKARREKLTQAQLDGKLAEQRDANRAAAKARKHGQAEQRAEAGTSFKTVSLVAVITMMAVTLPAQIAYFLALGANGRAWELAPAPIGLEMLAWVGVTGTSWGRRKGLPLWPFWIVTAALAAFAGSINYTHVSAVFGLVAGRTLGAFSLLAPLVWEGREWLAAKAAVDNRDRRQRAADKAAARAAAAAAKLDQAHTERRRKDQPAVWAEYEQILIAHPRGSVDTEAVWADAWFRVHRAPLGYTAKSYQQMVTADGDLAGVLEQLREASVYREIDRDLNQLFGGPEPDDGTPAAPSGPTPSDGPLEGAGALGGIGLRARGRQARKDATEPLRDIDLTAARALLRKVGQDLFSTPAIAKEIGRSKVYAKRVRDAVLAERN